MTEQHVAVVTGASVGIGRSVAADLAERGYAVWAVARRAELLEKLAADYPAVIPAPADLTVDDDVTRLVEHMGRQTPVVSVLIQSAGSYSYGPYDEVPTEPLRRQLAVNVESAYQLTHELLAFMPGPGDVVFLNSSQGVRATATVGQFAASMHARKALADSLRAEVNERDIRVTTVHLGRTATPRQEEIYDAHDWRYDPELLLQPTDVATMIGTVIALPRTAEVTDISMRPAIKSY
jgi:NADP-dependent 3-hydroxy acid dehydrogenase YdfG